MQSDARIKTDIVNLPGCLQKLTAIRPVQFKYIFDENNVYSGFIAQEYVMTFPQFTSVNPDDDGVSPLPDDGFTRPWSLSYAELVPYLVGAIKELNSKIEALQAQINGGT